MTYLGTIEDRDVQMRSNKADRNTFYWCTIVSDISLYSYQDVNSLTDELSKVGSHHVQIDATTWDVIMQHV